ncbi:MAG: acetolactate synthase small subunit [Candidatus Bathyarchaeota archaeon]|nr:acetolactate synthase small subunit [Candidatus Bathyarchaeota archaeon]
MESTQNRVVSALVENKPGVLHSIANLFRRRNFNIESITVGVTEDTELSRITITVNADEKTLEQVVKQLDKLVCVVKVAELDLSNIVIRELALVKVHVPDIKEIPNITSCVDVFRGRVVDVARESLMVEITGTPDKIDAFLNLMSSFGVIELARTGITALSRGPKPIKNNI